jgi:hypothetical protein
MNELLTRFSPEDFIGLAAVVGAFLCGIPAVILGLWYAIRQVETAAALKQDMLNRGMSAEEIRTVIDAGSVKSRKDVRSLPSCHA